MFARSVVRAARPARKPHRTFASEADKATSNPQGTRGGSVPPQGDPKGNKDNTLLYAAAAVGVVGMGYFFMRGTPAAKKAEAKVKS